MRYVTILLIALCAALGGCQDDFDPPTLIASPRLLGARVSVEGDALRATPMPGETAHAEFVLAAPAGSYELENFSTLLVRCTYPSRFTGIPICQEFLDLAAMSPEGLDAALGAGSSSGGDLRFSCDQTQTLEADGVQLLCINGKPEVDVTLPSDLRAGDVLLRGVVCPQGQATFDPSLPALFTCVGAKDGEGDADGIVVHMRLPVAYDDTMVNHNPDPAALGLTLNGLPFPVGISPPSERDCMETADADGIRVIDPFDHELGVGVPRSQREETPGGPRETFELSAFATSGEVGQRFTLISDDDPSEADGSVEKAIPWSGRDTVDYGESRRVDFWITVRDQRGGLAVLARSACIELADPF